MTFVHAKPKGEGPTPAGPIPTHAPPTPSPTTVERVSAAGSFPQEPPAPRRATSDTKAIEELVGYLEQFSKRKQRRLVGLLYRLLG
ncbi:MAG TPA: hypothetical protein VF748_14685 [Candidatus Acidoferrum sp.]